MHPPSSLVKWQETFGKVLLRKLPTTTFKPKNRMEIYLESYEGKLCSAFEFHFPTLPLLLGSQRFYNEIAIPFIRKNPPRDWCIETFSRGLLPWVTKNGLSRHSPLLLPLLQIDLAFLNAHFPEERSGCLNEDVQVVETFFPVVELRKALLNGEEPPSYEKKKRAFVVFPDVAGKLYSREIEPLHGRLLKWMETHSFEEAIEALVQETTLPLDSLASLLPTWSAMWGELRWIDEKKLS